MIYLLYYTVLYMRHCEVSHIVLYTMYVLTYYRATPPVASKRQQEGTRSHQEPPGDTRSHQEPPGATGNHREPPGGTGRHEEPPGATRSHQEPPGATRTHQEAPGATRTHQEPPGGTRSHQQSLAIPVYPCHPTAPYKSD